MSAETPTPTSLKEAGIRGVLDATPVGIAVLDRSLRLIYVNAALQRVLGTTKPLVGQMCYEAYFGTRQGCPSCPAQASFRDGATHVIERAAVLAGGRRAYLRLSTAVIRDKAGAINYVVETCDDISSATQLAVQVAQSERKYYAMLHNANDPILLCDPATGKFLEVNRKACDLTAYSKDELLGMAVRDIFAESARSSAAAAFQKVASGGAGTFGELLVQRKDGRLVPVEMSASLISHATSRMLQAILHDITERKRFEQERERRVRELKSFETISKSLAAAIAMEELIDLVLAGLPNVVPCDLCAIHLCDQGEHVLYFHANGPVTQGVAAGLEALVARLAAEVPTHAATFHAVKAQPLGTTVSDVGRDLKIESYLSAPVNATGRPAGFLIAAAARKNAFSQNAANILSTLANETGLAFEKISLYRKNLQAERLAAVGETVASIAHRVTNAASSLAGSSLLLDAAVQARDWDRLDRSWQVIKRSLDSMSRLVLNMLNYSKEREPIPEPTDVRGLVTTVVAQVAERARRGGVEIATSLEGDLANIPLDADQIEHCIENLVANALDAMPDGGRLTLAASRLPRSTETAQLDRIVIRIGDTGVGIPPDIMPRIFLPFFSSKGTRGTGLGLAVSKKIVEEHGGQIEVESAPGATTFTLSLPVRPLPRRAAPPQIPSP